MSDCIFCKIIAKEVPSEFVYEDEKAVAFRDLNPQAPTHLLIIPKKHISSLAEATDDDTELLGHLQKVARDIAVKDKLTGGFRLVTNNGRGAGQSVFHIHYHLLAGRSLTWPPG